jgi:hypothetical protein
MVIKNTTANSADEGMKLITHDGQDHIHKQQPKITCHHRMQTDKEHKQLQ